MASEVVMPRLSDTMDSGTIGRWLKSVGDTVKRGDIIAEIETDKANMELESYANGILAQILVSEGQSAGLGQPIALIARDAAEAKSLQDGPGGTDSRGANNESSTVTPMPGQETAPQAAAATGEAPEAGVVADVAPQAAQPAETTLAPVGFSGGRIKASPLAKRLAAEHGIELQAVSGTGPSGRITKEDVLTYVKQSGTSQAAPASQPTARLTGEPAHADHSPATGPRGAQPVEMTRMQNTIARRMAEARFSTPEFVLTAEFDMTGARALLATIKAVDGVPRVGPNDLLIKAVAQALVRHPEVNSGWEGRMVRYSRVNVAFAVTIPGGLVVPVVFDADRKSLGEISTESKALIEKARGGKLAPGEYEGGTFTISNLGMYGIDQFTPIINVPEACIMAVGAIVPQPVVVDGQVVVRDRMRVSLACDHRVINGAQGAEFLQTLRQLLENPVLALL